MNEITIEIAIGIKTSCNGSSCALNANKNSTGNEEIKNGCMINDLLVIFLFCIF